MILYEYNMKGYGIFVVIGNDWYLPGKSLILLIRIGC